MSYRLATLDLGHPGQPAAPVTPVPAMLDSPEVAEPAMLQGGFRPHRGFYRFIQRDGLIGIRVPEGLSGPVRVGVKLRVDPQGDGRWLDRHERLGGRPGSDLGPAPSVLGRPRLIRIGVQGRAAGLVVLRRREVGPRWVVQRAVTVVRNEEVRDSGLVLLSFDSPPISERPDYADSVTRPLIGVCVHWLRIARDSAAPPTVSTGLSGDEGWFSWLPDVGYATVNPGAGNHGVRIDLAPGIPASGRRLRPRSRRPVVAGVEVWSPASGDVPVRLSHGPVGPVVSLPGLAGPAYLRLLAPDGTPVRGAVRMRASALPA